MQLPHYRFHKAKIGGKWMETANNTYRQNNYPALRLFFDGIDFEANKFIYPQKWKETTIPPKNYNMEVFALRNFNKEKVMGWVHAASFWWGNISQNCQDHSGNTLTLPTDNDTYSSPLLPPPSQQFKVDHLKMLRKYDIDWYSTRLPISTPLLTVSKWTNIFGTLKPYFPLLGGPDYAFQAYKHGTSFRGLDDFAPTADTLFCGEDTIHVNGTYDDDIDGIYSYYWNFGNGQTSTLAHPTVVYSQPGVYNVSLIVIDTVGYVDTLSQQIVVINCEETQRVVNNLSDTNPYTKQSIVDIMIYPNPSFDVFNIVIKTLNSDSYSVEIYSGGGELIKDFSTNENNFAINLKGFPIGIYLIKFNIGKEVYYKKIILN